jgi:hypothetical protein
VKVKSETIHQADEEERIKINKRKITMRQLYQQ